MDKRKKSCIIIIVIALIVTGFMAVYRATNTRSVKSESGWRIVVCKVSEGWEGFLVCDKTHTGSVGTVKADVTMGGEHLLYTDIKPEENVLGFAGRYLHGISKKYTYTIFKPTPELPKSITAKVEWDGSDTEGMATIEYNK